MAGPVVSVLVVTYNNAGEVRECLEALDGQRWERGPVEVVVADNGSTDGTADVVEALGLGSVRLVRLARNVGFAGGVNAAAAAMAPGSRFVALVNPDCVLDDGSLAALCRHLETTPGVGVAAARLRNPDGSPQLFARRELSLPLVASAMTATGRLVDRRLLGGRAADHRCYARETLASADRPLAVDCPAAAAVVTWRVLLPEPPLDERLPLFFNDAQLFRRIRARGYRCEIVPSAGAVHGYGTSHRRLERDRRDAEFTRSLLAYARGGWGIGRGAALWALLAGDAAASAVRAVTGPDRGEARVAARGTLGGLGLPGGAEPWLSPPEPTRARVRRALGRVRRTPQRAAAATSQRVRRRLFLVRLHLSAWVVRASVTADVHPTADVAADVHLEIRPGADVRLTVGERARLQPGTILRLAGELHLGPYSELRYGVDVNAKGRLVMEGRNVLGRGTTVHADTGTTQVWEWGATVAEHVTVVDNDHPVDGSLVHALDHPDALGDIRLGAACLVGAGSVVTRGVTVGRGSVVGANSVVSRDVPPAVVAVGAPARPIRGLPNGAG